MWRITVAGSIGFDDVTTPHGHRMDQPGGSAVYFSLAASQYAHVDVVGVIGTDGVEALNTTVSGADISIKDVSVSTLPTYRWHAVHDFQTWVATDETSTFGAYEGWIPHLSPTAARADVLFVGSMNPALQEDILVATPDAQLIGIDSMEVFIRSALPSVMRVVERADLLFLNVHELAALLRCDESVWESQAVSFLAVQRRLKALIVKRGPEGATIITRHGSQTFAAAPVDVVIDPTGAGDALAGGFLGWCAQNEAASPDTFEEALSHGLRKAADAISHFGVVGLKPAALTS